MQITILFSYSHPYSPDQARKYSTYAFAVFRTPQTLWTRITYIYLPLQGRVFFLFSELDLAAVLEPCWCYFTFGLKGLHVCNHRPRMSPPLILCADWRWLPKGISMTTSRVRTQISSSRTKPSCVSLKIEVVKVSSLVSFSKFRLCFYQWKYSLF